MNEQDAQKQSIQALQQFISSSTTTMTITANLVQNRSEQSNLSPTSSINPLRQSSNGRSINEQSHLIAQDSKLGSNPLKTSSAVSKQWTTHHSQRENHSFVSTIFFDDYLNDFFIFCHWNRTGIDSTDLNESSTAPLTEHQSNWTVKSTIVTAYTQGYFKSLKRFSINPIITDVGEVAGPRLISKVISEAWATSSSDTLVKTTIEDISGEIGFVFLRISSSKKFL